MRAEGLLLAQFYTALGVAMLTDSSEEDLDRSGEQLAACSLLSGMNLDVLTESNCASQLG
jgi:hypothetical protein